MTYRIEEQKWILYRHTRSFRMIKVVAELLKWFSSAGIWEDEKSRLLWKLAEIWLYRERNISRPLDAINHRINTLAYYMFWYKDIVNWEKKFLFSPLWNLFLKKIDDNKAISKIFLTMLWAVQFPHPHWWTDPSFLVFPFRIIFKLLTDSRLDNKIYAFEFAYLIVFIKEINEEKYEELVWNILLLRSESNAIIEKKFKENEHLFVNAVYEWDYYVSELLMDAWILEKFEWEVICRLQHGKTNTFRKVTRNYVEIDKELVDYCWNLLSEYSYFEQPLILSDPERLTVDTIKEIYSFYPDVLLKEVWEQNDAISQILSLPKLIETYANNNEWLEAYLFEDVLTEWFNMFYNVEAKKIWWAWNTDIECLYTTKSKKFAVDAKSTKNKLSIINSWRLNAHREKIGGKYTIVITPRYVPAVREDIRWTNIVIILANTFSEYLYNNLSNNIREIDYSEFDNLIIDNLWKDISPLISNLTFNKFAINEPWKQS